MKSNFKCNCQPKLKQEVEDKLDEDKKNDTKTLKSFFVLLNYYLSLILLRASPKHFEISSTMQKYCSSNLDRSTLSVW